MINIDFFYQTFNIFTIKILSYIKKQGLIFLNLLMVQLKKSMFYIVSLTINWNLEFKVWDLKSVLLAPQKLEFLL